MPLPDPSLHQDLEPQQPLKIQQALVGLRQEAKGIDLRFNLTCHDDSSIEYESLLRHAEGIDITMVKCQTLEKSITSSARFLTLRMTSDTYKTEALTKTAAHFPHVHDLKMILDDGDNLSLPEQLAADLQSFKLLTSLHLKVELYGALDLTALSCLRLLRISSSILVHKLTLPSNIEAFAYGAIGYDNMELSPHLLEHLSTLKHLRRIELKHFNVGDRSDFLQSLPQWLLSLDVRLCVLPEFLGTPHSKLKELRIGRLSKHSTDFSSLTLSALSCTWGMMKSIHRHHLRILKIEWHGSEGHHVKSFTQYTALTDLWIPMRLLTESAMKKASNKQEILHVFPSALKILVLYDPEQEAQNSGSLDFEPFKHLRSLGLPSSSTMIDPLKLPIFLHTIAVKKSLIAAQSHALHALRRSTWVVPMTDIDSGLGLG